jgi:hypothetical protein
MEMIWKDPPVHQRVKGVSKKDELANTAIQNPERWFILHEGAKVRPASRPFNGSLWERAYRTEIVDGVKIHRTYVRYIGQRYL